MSTSIALYSPVPTSSLMNTSTPLTITNPTTKCQFLQTNARLVDSFTFLAYYILMPARFLIGVTNQSIALRVFKSQSKTDSSYAYQIFSSGAKIFEICEFTVCITLKFFLAGMNGIGTSVDAYTRTYWLMVLAANVFVYTQVVVVSLSLLLSAAMAVDRFFAMYRPFVYRNLNKRRHHTIALLVCILIAITTSFDYSIRYVIVERPTGKFEAITNAYYNQATWTGLLNYCRTAMRFATTAIFLVCNALCVKLYKRHLAHFKQFSTGDSSRVGDSKRRRHEKTLFALTIFQAPFVLFNMTLFAVQSLGVLFKPTFPSCEGGLVLALSDIGIEMTDILEFYVVLCASKEFRRMVRAVLPGRKKQGVVEAKAISSMRVSSVRW